MAEDYAQDDFDWVTAQADCTPESMFARLLAGVKKDVERRNALPGADNEWRFEVEEDADRFEVARSVTSSFGTSRVDALVIFERDGRDIHIHSDHVDVDLTAIVTLDDTGTCRFVVGEAEYSDWQIRKQALTQLFFDPSPENWVGVRLVGLSAG